VAATTLFGLCLLGDGLFTLLGLGFLLYGIFNISFLGVLNILSKLGIEKSFFEIADYFIFPLRTMDAALSLYLLSKIDLAYPAGTLIDTLLPVYPQILKP